MTPTQAELDKPSAEAAARGHARVAFERWAARAGLDIERINKGPDYRVPLTRVAWEAWQAARAAIGGDRHG